MRLVSKDQESEVRMPGWCVYQKSLEGAPEIEIVCGGINDKAFNAAAIWRQGHLVHFGFEPSPEQYNETGRKLLANTIAYAARFTEDRPIETTPSIWTDDVRSPSRLDLDGYLAKGEDLPEFWFDDAITETRDGAELSAWFVKHRAHLVPNKAGALALDERLTRLDVDPATPAFFNVCIARLREGGPLAKDAGAALTRFAPDGPRDASADAWETWHRETSGALFFTELGGYRWHVDPLALARHEPTQELRGPRRATPRINTNAPLRVFILAGQSNMEGQAVVDLVHERDYNGGRGTLLRLMEDEAFAKRYAHLRSKDGSWSSRDDVWVSYKPANGPLKTGDLSIGFAVYEGRHHFGPELQIGHVLGDHFSEPVLVIKTAWGGKSLHRDLRPPSAGGEVGPYYRQMIAETREALAQLAARCPRYDGRPYRIEGFFWFQGWNDAFDGAASTEYERNLVHLIHDVRKEFGDPTLPVVIGETGNLDDGPVRRAQAAVATRKELAQSMRFVPTEAFRRPAEQSPNTGHGHHWFGNAESYLLIGTALGKAMVEILDSRR